MAVDINMTSHMSQLLKLLQRQRSFLGFAEKASDKTRICYKMDKGN